MAAQSNELANDQLAKQEDLHKRIYDFEFAIGPIEETPLINRILVLPFPLKATTKAGIIIPDNAKERPEVGTVIATGTGRVLDNGHITPPLVTPGDKVTYGKWSGTWVHNEELDLDLLLLLDADCLTRKVQPHLVAPAPASVTAATETAE